MRVWIIYSAGRITSSTGDVAMRVYMVRGKQRQHPNDAQKAGGKTLAFYSSDPDMPLAKFRQECKKKSRTRR
jgi:hypothetical protein